MKCAAMASCVADAVYDLTTTDGQRVVACTSHANAIDDHGLVSRAFRLDGAADYMRAMRAKKREAGLCCDCSSPAVPGQSRCERHRRRVPRRKMVRP